jgi:hypothetical protein
VMPQVFAFDETIPSAEARQFKTHEAQHAEKNAPNFAFRPKLQNSNLAQFALHVVWPVARQRLPIWRLWRGLGLGSAVLGWIG